MRDMTLSRVDRLDAAAVDAEQDFVLDEDAFRAFYDRTARALWVYLSRMTGDAQASDDLLQEVYYRFLRSGQAFESEAHRRHYVFRIATNLARDGWRRRQARPDVMPLHAPGAEPRAAGAVDDQAIRRTDLRRALGRMSARERALVWLAYAEGSSHQEIASVLGVKCGSIKPLLWRARRKLGRLLGGTARASVADPAEGGGRS
jgi:RNA polymerase sigma-70 factor (ECF subfamily)